MYGTTSKSIKTFSFFLLLLVHCVAGSADGNASCGPEGGVTGYTTLNRRSGCPCLRRVFCSVGWTFFLDCQPIVPLILGCCFRGCLHVNLSSSDSCLESPPRELALGMLQHVTCVYTFAKVGRHARITASRKMQQRGVVHVFLRSFCRQNIRNRSHIRVRTVVVCAQGLLRTFF